MVRDVKTYRIPTLRFQAHPENHTSHHTICFFVKSLQAHPMPTRGLKDCAAKIKDRLTNDKNGQLVTRGIFYCRDSAEINGCDSLQTSSRFDSDVLRSRQQKHTAIRS
jgi:hypothetical protein